MRETIYITRTEDKAAPELKRIRPQFVLLMPCLARSLSRRGVVPPEQM